MPLSEPVPISSAFGIGNGAERLAPLPFSVQVILDLNAVAVSKSRHRCLS